jgi:hypothetical protein
MRQNKQAEKQSFNCNYIAFSEQKQQLEGQLGTIIIFSE